MAITTAEGIANLAMHRLGAEKVSDITTSPSSAEEIACNDMYEQIRDEMLMGSFSIPELGNYNWQFAKRFVQLFKEFGYDDTDGFDEITITGITKANPAVVTAASHSFTDGWIVYISGVSGMTEINKLSARVASGDTNTFQCYGLDSTNFTAYTSGGTVVRREPLGDYSSLGYAYTVPADLLKIVTIEDKDAQLELVGSGDSERILSDYEEPILVYIKQITTVTEFPIPFIRALAGRLAYELASSLSGKNVGEMYKMYKIEVNSAISADAKNVTPGSLIKQTNRIVEEGGWG